jgi:hypothetical protein
MTYMVAITEPNSWHIDGSAVIRKDCGHKHRTLTGAYRCAHRLGRTYADGTWDEWQAFGRTMHTDGSPLTGEEKERLIGILVDAELR